MRPGTLALTLVLLAGCAESDGQDPCPQPAPVFSLPADEAPHHGKMEWWYYTGHLWTAADRRYGFEYSFFQIAQQEVATYVAHFAVSDGENREHHYDQRTGTEPEMRPRFDLSLGDWTLSGNGSVDRLRASMEEFAIDLELVPLKPPAIHNHNGIIPMGGGLDSCYYSKTRLDVSGTLALGEVLEPVTGMAWSDHQWGDFEIFGSDGWDWFSIQLNDMSEIMIFMLHFKGQGTQVTGATFVDPDGCQQEIGEIQIDSRRNWESPETGHVYPLGWDLVVPELSIELSITPVFDAQEMDARATTLIVYWEGETRVSGTRAGRPVEGFGYVELTGYGAWGPQ